MSNNIDRLVSTAEGDLARDRIFAEIDAECIRLQPAPEWVVQAAERLGRDHLIKQIARTVQLIEALDRRAAQ